MRIKMSGFVLAVVMGACTTQSGSSASPNGVTSIESNAWVNVKNANLVEADKKVVISQAVVAQFPGVTATSSWDDLLKAIPASGGIYMNLQQDGNTILVAYASPVDKTVTAAAPNLLIGLSEDNISGASAGASVTLVDSGSCTPHATSFTIPSGGGSALPYKLQLLGSTVAADAALHLLFPTDFSTAKLALDPTSNACN